MPPPARAANLAGMHGTTPHTTTPDRRTTLRPTRIARRRVGTALLLVAALATACGSDDTDDSAAGSDSDRTETSTTTTAASDDTTPTAPATDPAPDDAGGTPAAWPAGLPLPTAVDPTGAQIPGSLEETANPEPGDIMLFTFRQAEGTALQSAFTGVGRWAQDELEDFPGGTPCSKDEASSAALNGGTWSCDGALADGRLVQVAVSTVNQRLSLDVLIKSTS